jgi:hypothetical protein
MMNLEKCTQFGFDGPDRARFPGNSGIDRHRLGPKNTRVMTAPSAAGFHEGKSGQNGPWRMRRKGNCLGREFKIVTMRTT